MAYLNDTAAELRAYIGTFLSAGRGADYVAESLESGTDAELVDSAVQNLGRPFAGDYSRDELIQAMADYREAFQSRQAAEIRASTQEALDTLSVSVEPAVEEEDEDEDRVSITCRARGGISETVLGALESAAIALAAKLPTGAVTEASAFGVAVIGSEEDGYYARLELRDGQEGLGDTHTWNTHRADAQKLVGQLREGRAGDAAGDIAGWFEDEWITADE